MKKYRFGYYEFVKNYKFMEIILDDEVDPSTIAETLFSIDELINWEIDGIVTTESEIKFSELEID